jgi:hypothetical protein
MKTGIGIVTTPARMVDEGVARFKQPETDLFIHNDVERVGVGVSRNRCIKTLYDAGCDWLFILDDDVRVIASGFERYFIEQATAHDIHWLGLPEIFKSRFVCNDREMIWFDACIGAFHFMSRHAVETVGYFNAGAYDGYGWEDAAYMARLRRAGVAGRITNASPSPLRASAYFMSDDVYGCNPAPNWTPDEKRAGIERNRDAASREAHAGPVYYPFVG